MKKRIIATILSILICAVIFTGCSDGAISGGTTANGGSSSSGGTSITILGSSWYRDSYGHVHQSYVAEVKNDNKSKAAQLAQVTITIKDADGKIIKTGTNFAGTIAAGDTLQYANELMFDGGDPKTISASVTTPSYGYTDNQSAIYSSEVQVSNTSYISGQFYSRVTGEITNSSNKNCTMARVSVILKKNGEVIGGTYTYVNNINSGSTVPFEVYVDEGGFDFDTYQVVAVPWM